MTVSPPARLCDLGSCYVLAAEPCSRTPPDSELVHILSLEGQKGGLSFPKLLPTWAVEQLHSTDLQRQGPKHPTPSRDKLPTIIPTKRGKVGKRGGNGGKRGKVGKSEGEWGGMGEHTNCSFAERNWLATAASDQRLDDGGCQALFGGEVERGRGWASQHQL